MLPCQQSGRCCDLIVHFIFQRVAEAEAIGKITLTEFGLPHITLVLCCFGLVALAAMAFVMGLRIFLVSQPLIRPPSDVQPCCASIASRHTIKRWQTLAGNRRYWVRPVRSG